MNHAVIGTRGLARTYGDDDVDRVFRVNGLATPSDSTYARLASEHFTGYRLVADGAAEHPQSFSLADLRGLQSLTQTTRHDCVEGWSAIGKWSGVPLAKLLALVKPRPEARYVVFHCLDRDDGGTPYYESWIAGPGSAPASPLGARSQR